MNGKKIASARIDAPGVMLSNLESALLKYVRPAQKICRYSDTLKIPMKRS